MRIFKPGNKELLNPEYVFRCDKCFCEFAENQDNCKACEQYNEVDYMARCPTCGNQCYSRKKV